MQTAEGSNSRRVDPDALSVVSQNYQFDQKVVSLGKVFRILYNSYTLELTAANAKLTESNAKLSSALDTSTKTNSKLSESLIEAQKTIQLLQTENYELKLRPETSPGPDKLPYNSTYVKPPAYSDIAKMVIKTMGEAEQLKEKSQRAVIEKLPEFLDQTKFLTDLIKELPENHGIKIEQCHRHGSEKPDRARIIKVQFDSTSNRNNFFRNFRPALNSLINKTIANSGKPPKFLKIRRDMTQTELQEMFASRKFCYEENLKINGRKYYVHDTQVREFNEIKPFANQG